MASYNSTYDPSMEPKDLDFIRYEKRGPIAIVTISRPEVRNALHTYAYQELRACWRDIANDPDVRVGILTGDGEAFCAGRDVKFLASFQAAGKRTPHEDPTSPLFHWGGGGQPQDIELEKPLVAAINGFAVGVGLNMIMQCQLRVMAEGAWLGDQHTNVGRLGAPHELYAAMPRTAAAFLTLCNGRLGAEECKALGIVNRVVPRERVLDEAMVLAEMVARNAPLAVQTAVRVMRLTGEVDPSLKSYVRYLDQAVAESDDGAEGSAAFVGKRSPQWQGK